MTTPLSDAAVIRLRDAFERPDLPERYALREVIGHGGMGVVWRAFDAHLDRDVAVKVIAPHLDSREFTARLEREARILAQLEHPGIVPVHDVGRLDDGRAWYVMRLVKGARLDQAARKASSRGELLRIFERLCDSVAFAHAHGVIHRDLKPGNVMIGPFGEVLVLDWGVAREAGKRDAALGARDPQPTRHPDASSSGVVVGTPGYMAPEQAAGAKVDERSDVYGLGAILRDLCDAHTEAVPNPLRSIQDTALANEPEDRYQSAIALRDDIRRFLDGARVEAHRETLVEAAGRFVNTYQTPILLVLAYLLMRLAILWWRGV